MIRPDLSLPLPEHHRSGALHRHRRSGMSGLARMFLERGIRVSGSDRADSQALRHLASLGATVSSDTTRRIWATPTPSCTRARIWPENPEFLLAKKRGTPGHPPLTGPRSG